MKNIKGTVTPVALLIFLSITALFLQALQLMLESKSALENRSRAYLCFKYQLTRTRHHVRAMGKLNRILQASYHAQFLPGQEAAASATHQATLRLQDAAHLRYYKNVLHNRHCPRGAEAFFLQATPYKHQGPHLERLPDGTTQLRSQQWDLFYRHQGMLLQAKLEITSPLSRRIAIASDEPALSNWRGFSGWERW